MGRVAGVMLRLSAEMDVTDDSLTPTGKQTMNTAIKVHYSAINRLFVLFFMAVIS